MNEITDFFEKILFAEVIGAAISHLMIEIKKGISPQRDRKNLIEAITAIQAATIKTRNFITDSGYQRNEDLTALWHTALDKTVAANINDNLPDYLYQKAKFWGEPKQWLENPQTLELIPKLAYLDEKCDMLLIVLKRLKN